MNPLQQVLFEEETAPVAPAGASASAPAAAPAPVSASTATPEAAPLRAIPSDAGAAAPAQQLWAAVQCDAWSTEDAQPSLADLPAGAVPSRAALVKRAQGFTPRVALESTDALLLELAGSRRLFGGLPALLQALRAAFPRPLRLSLAPTPLAAVLLARAGSHCCILSFGRLKGRLAPLPLAHLRWPEEELRRLQSMGVRTLAELLRLPRAGLARRLGPERLWQLDRLTGTRADPREPLAQEEAFRARIDPDGETFDRDRLLAALRPALERLEIFLRERQRGVMALRLRLHHRRAGPLHCLLRCVVPEYRASRFEALLAARLESLLLAEPVRRLDLAAGRLWRFKAASHALWTAAEQGGAVPPGAAPEFLQMLLARLGEHAVYGLEQVDEHRPERQQRRVGATRALPGRVESLPGRVQALPGGQASAARAPHGVSTPPGVPRPLALFEPPRPLETSRDAAGHVRALRHAGQKLTLLSGPERIESGWWDGADIARDYYVARAADGARWWIFRECEAPGRWFLHGCFA